MMTTSLWPKAENTCTAIVMYRLQDGLRQALFPNLFPLEGCFHSIRGCQHYS